jgi:hypothetical protein
MDAMVIGEDAFINHPTQGGAPWQRNVHHSAAA